jgi:hypothetical protein
MYDIFSRRRAALVAENAAGCRSEAAVGLNRPRSGITGAMLGSRRRWPYGGMPRCDVWRCPNGGPFGWVTRRTDTSYIS